MSNYFAKWRETLKAQRAEALAYHRLLGQIQELHRWCGEFPEIEAATEWLLSNDAAYHGRPNTLGNQWRAGISDFREQLRSAEAVRRLG